MSGRRMLFSMKHKLCVGIVATIAVAVAIVCFVALSHPVSSAAAEDSATVNHKRSVEFEPKDNSFAASEPKVNKRSRRQSESIPLTRGGTSSRSQSTNEINCYSYANDTIPAAHIKGRGRFSKPDGSSMIPGYKQKWTCSDIDPHQPHHLVHAFVDGGMSFDHMEKKLHVPKCGYYHISSQILFVYDSKSENGHANVKHLLKFNRNCQGWPEDNALLVMGLATVHPGNSTTTFASDVVKLCRGGTVWVEIPETHKNDLYPRGDDHATFLTAVLVAETSCHWPPKTTMDNPDHSHDE